MKKILKQKKGITLIALVITIIVLLILAGISISMLSGDNGILQKATDAKTNTENASLIEQVKIDILGQIAENNGSNITKEQLATILSKYFKPFETTSIPDEIISEEDDGDLLLETIDGKYKMYLSKIYQDSFENNVELTSVTNLMDGDIVSFTDANENEIQCFVLYNNSSPNGIQIITSDTLPNINLGKNDTSQNAEGSSGSTTRARWSYNNAIDTLNAYAETYRLQNLSNIATSARCVGSVPNNPSSRNTEKLYPSDYMFLINSDWDTYFKDQYESEDSNYIEDVEKMDTLRITRSNKKYWLASREISWGDDGQGETKVMFHVRNIDDVGSLGKSEIVLVSDSYGELARYSNSWGVRAVFTLNPTSHYIEENGIKKIVE